MQTQVENPQIEAIELLNRYSETLRPSDNETAFSYATRAEQAKVMPFMDAYWIRLYMPNAHYANPEISIFIGCPIHGWLNEVEWLIFGKAVLLWSFNKMKKEKLYDQPIQPLHAR